MAGIRYNKGLSRRGGGGIDQIARTASAEAKTAVDTVVAPVGSEILPSKSTFQDGNLWVNNTAAGIDVPVGPVAAAMVAAGFELTTQTTIDEVVVATADLSGDAPAGANLGINVTTGAEFHVVAGKWAVSKAVETDPIYLADKPAIQTHIADTVKHMTAAEKAKLHDVVSLHADSETALTLTGQELKLTLPKVEAKDATPTADSTKAVESKGILASEKVITDALVKEVTDRTAADAKVNLALDITDANFKLVLTKPDATTVDVPLPIINDITTGGAKALLSAEQGKVLANLVNGIGERKKVGDNVAMAADTASPDGTTFHVVDDGGLVPIKWGVYMRIAGVDEFVFGQNDLISALRALTADQAKTITDTTPGLVTGMILFDREQAVKGIVDDFEPTADDHEVAKPWDAKTIADAFASDVNTITGAGVPLDALGKDGDYYRQSDAGQGTFAMRGPKAAGAWPLEATFDLVAISEPYIDIINPSDVGPFNIPTSQVVDIATYDTYNAGKGITLATDLINGFDGVIQINDGGVLVDLPIVLKEGGRAGYYVVSSDSTTATTAANTIVASTDLSEGRVLNVFSRGVHFAIENNTLYAQQSAVVHGLAWRPTSPDITATIKQGATVTTQSGNWGTVAGVTPPEPTLYRGHFATDDLANAAVTDGKLGEYVTISPADVNYVDNGGGWVVDAPGDGSAFTTDDDATILAATTRYPDDGNALMSATAKWPSGNYKVYEWTGAAYSAYPEDNNFGVIVAKVTDLVAQEGVANIAVVRPPALIGSFDGAKFTSTAPLDIANSLYKNGESGAIDQTRVVVIPVGYNAYIDQTNAGIADATFHVKPVGNDGELIDVLVKNDPASDINSGVDLYQTLTNGEILFVGAAQKAAATQLDSAYIPTTGDNFPASRGQKVVTRGNSITVADGEANGDTITLRNDDTIDEPISVAVLTGNFRVPGQTALVTGARLPPATEWTGVWQDNAWTLTNDLPAVLTQTNLSDGRYLPPRNVVAFAPTANMTLKARTAVYDTRMQGFYVPSSVGRVTIEQEPTEVTDAFVFENGQLGRSFEIGPEHAGLPFHITDISATNQHVIWRSWEAADTPWVYPVLGVIKSQRVNHVNGDANTLPAPRNGDWVNVYNVHATDDATVDLGGGNNLTVKARAETIYLYSNGVGWFQQQVDPPSTTANTKTVFGNNLRTTLIDSTDHLTASSENKLVTASGPITADNTLGHMRLAFADVTSFVVADGIAGTVATFSDDADELADGVYFVSKVGPVLRFDSGSAAAAATDYVPNSYVSSNTNLAQAAVTIAHGNDYVTAWLKKSNRNTMICASPGEARATVLARYGCTSIQLSSTIGASRTVWTADVPKGAYRVSISGVTLLLDVIGESATRTVAYNLTSSSNFNAANTWTNLFSGLTLLVGDTVEVEFWGGSRIRTASFVFDGTNANRYGHSNSFYYIMDVSGAAPNQTVRAQVVYEDGAIQGWRRMRIIR